MLDFDHWLPDDEVAETTMDQQIELYEKIVRLFEGKIHPLVAFNPLKEALYTGVDEDEQRPFNIVKKAVEERGFIGVKLYPPMGFFPIDNTRRITDSNDPSYDHREDVDKALIDLYNWCVDEDVPIMVHCADSNESQPEYEYGKRASPEYWKDVLQIYPGLRLNLGHFGHDVKNSNYGPGWPDEYPTGWAWYIAKELMYGSTYPYVYADTGYHIDFLPPMWLQPTGDTDIDDFTLSLSLLSNIEYFDALDVLFYDSNLDGNVQERLMYGSDSHVLMVHPWYKHYANKFKEYFDNNWSNNNLTDAFLGLNALHFFGLDNPDNKNRQRLLEFYVKHNMTEKPNWWVGDWWAPDTVAPLTPANLSTAPISSTEIGLSWDASTDNVIVTGYKIYRNGMQIDTTTGTTYQDTGLSPSTTYTYTVSAYDAVGNESSQSISVSATTM